MTPDDPRHGTVSGYTRGGCREECCRAAIRPHWRRASERLRRRRGAAPQVTGRTHGTRATYVAGCSCAPCRAAEAAYRRDYRARVAS